MISCAICIFQKYILQCYHNSIQGYCRCAPCFGSNLRNVSKMADFCIFKEFHKISKIFDLVSIISIWQIMLLLYLVSSLYVLKISIFYMKINLATAIHCGRVVDIALMQLKGTLKVKINQSRWDTFFEKCYLLLCVTWSIPIDWWSS